MGDIGTPIKRTVRRAVEEEPQVRPGPDPVPAPAVPAARPALPAPAGAARGWRPRATGRECVVAGAAR